MSTQIMEAVVEAFGFGLSLTLTLFGIFILYLIISSRNSRGGTSTTLMQVAFTFLSLGLSGLYFVVI